MKNLLLIIVLISFIFLGCGSNKIQEGEIKYSIEYPNPDISDFMLYILPEEMNITFKGTKMKTSISRGKIFTTEIISDEATRLVEMRLYFGDDLLYTVLSEEEIKTLIASQPNYISTPTNQNDSINNLLSNEYRVSCDDDTIQRRNAWFTKDLAPQSAYWFTSYADVEGFPLIYDAERYGVMMNFQSDSLITREVDESEFDRDPDLEKVSFEFYENKVQELFDALILN